MHKSRILFIALAHSTHTLSWIDLLSVSDFEVMLYGINGSLTPDNLKMRYFSVSESYLSLILKRIVRLLSKIFTPLKTNDYFKDDVNYLKKIIKKHKPDLIHTLGFDSAGYILHETLKKIEEKNFIWIHTSRGSELSLKGYLPEALNREIIINCDGFIADSNLHYRLAVELGLAENKIPSFGFVPGSGGIDIEDMRANVLFPVSKRERIILWPKAYECQFSKALPVYEALKIAWDRIKPCRIIMTAMIPETQMWFNYLPDEIKNSSITYDRIPQDELLDIMKKSRILLAPTLSDGIPNSLYEAMGTGAVPIISPLETFTDIVINMKNAIYARNLYPEEIAEAIVLAMNDDQIADSISSENIELLLKIGDRKIIKKNLLDYYKSMFNKI